MEHTQLETFANKNLDSLMAREWDVLLLVAEDIYNGEIADKLHLTSASVKTYRSRIGGKLMLSGRDSLAKFARRNKQWLCEKHVQFYLSPLIKVEYSNNY